MSSTDLSTFMKALQPEGLPASVVSDPQADGLAEVMEIAAFLQAVHGLHEGGVINIWTGADKRSRLFPASPAGYVEAAKYAVSMRDTGDVYHGVGRLRGLLPAGRRGTKRDIGWIDSIWADLDVHGEHHKGDNLPTMDEAVAAIERMPVPPSVMVNSGGGLHLYYALEQPLEIRDEADLHRAEQIVGDWQNLLRQKLAGKHLDKTSDLSRLLRVPHTLNHKPRRYDRKPIEVMLISPADIDGSANVPTYDLEVFESVKTEALRPVSTTMDLLEGPDVLEGERTNWLIRSAGSLRHLGFSNAQIRQILSLQNESRCKPPLAEKEFEEVVGRYDAQSSHPDDLAADGPDSNEHDSRMRPDSFEWTSLGNARRLVRMLGDRIRYAHDEKGWFIWNGKYWEKDARMCINSLYRHMVDGMRIMAALMPDDDPKRKPFLQWIGKCESRKLEDDSIRQATAERAVSGLMSDFDNNADLLTVANGTLDLRTGELKPHDPANMLTRHIDIDYDCDAECPMWAKFLLDIQAGDQEMVDYLQRCLGYSLTADVSEQCVFVCQGHGSNGKSTMINTVLSVVGEYGSTTDRNLLVLSRRDHPTSIYALRGIRFAVTSEARKDEHLSEDLIKQMTGEPEIQARGMCKDFCNIKVTWKIWLSTNHAPRIRGSDYGIRRRLKIIPFDVTFSDDQQDKGAAGQAAAGEGGYSHLAGQGLHGLA